MSLQQTARRQDQPVRLGARHGYRIEGDQAFINAELSLPPYLSGGHWALELWACPSPHQNGDLSGVRISEVALDLPTPLAPYVHQVNARSDARLPLQGQAYAMVLALVERCSDGASILHDFANYSERQSFAAPRFVGSAGYALEGEELILRADALENPRALGNLSGSLALELWAEAAHAPSARHRLGVLELACIGGQAQLSNVEGRARFTAPPAGTWRLALVLSEWTEAFGFIARDRREFSLPFEQLAALPAPEAPAPVTAVTPVAAPAAAPVAAAVPAAAPPAVAAPVARAGVSIQTASVEELAKVNGLNPKLAKEIVKARPFKSLNDLLKIKGIGEKTLQRLKALLTL
jgi:competence ComEA-like helix-hairpin-helix protein